MHICEIEDAEDDTFPRRSAPTDTTVTPLKHPLCLGRLYQLTHPLPLNLTAVIASRVMDTTTQII